MKRRIFVLVITLIYLSTTNLLGQAKELTFESEFNTNHLNTVNITFESSDWRLPLNTTSAFVNADIRINDREQVSVQIARKGNSSSNNTLDRDKIPFNVDGPGSFNFKLNNSYRDYTMGAREYIGYKLHQEYSGVASNIAATEVYVNGEFYGFYLAVEDLNAQFYKRNIGSISQRIKASPTTTEVYDGKPYSNLFWLGEDPKHYEGRYEIKKGSFKELISLIDIINNDPANAYKVIDIEQVCKFLAVENYLLNIDGIIGEVYSHNYELVKRKYDDKWQLVPWDLNMSLGAWSKPSIASEDDAIEILTQLPLTSGKSNNALIGLIMDQYFFLYHYYYQQLIEQVDDGRLISWADNYKDIIDGSKQKDDKLYVSDLYKRAFTEDLTTSDGYVTALIPTIKKRHSYVQSLSLDKKFSNKISIVEQSADSVFVKLAIGMTNESVIIEYLNSEEELKRVRAIRVPGKKRDYFCILPEEAISYYTYVVHKGVKYSYPYNGLLGFFNVGS
jgi:hypothetical protein